MNWRLLLDKKLEEWLLMAMLISMVLLVFLQVVARVMNISVGWSSELSRFLLIWITWLSAAYVIRTREHIRIMTLVEKFHPKVQKGIEVFVIICWFFFAIIMAVVGTEIVLNIKAMGQTSAALQWPTWIIYLILPIGGILIIIRLIQQIYFIFRKDTNERREHA